MSRGVSKIEQRLASKIESGEFYEAHQMYRTIASRYKWVIKSVLFGIFYRYKVWKFPILNQYYFEILGSLFRFGVTWFYTDMFNGFLEFSITLNLRFYEETMIKISNWENLNLKFITLEEILALFFIHILERFST